MIVHRNLKHPDENYNQFHVGDRVAQILIRRRERIVWHEVDTEEELGTTDCGSGGFGSTGK